MTNLVALNRSTNTAAVSSNGVIVLIDTKRKDVLEVTSNFDASDAPGWTQYNNELVPPVWAELAEAATTTLAIETSDAADAERVLRVPKKVQTQSRRFGAPTTTLGDIHEFAQSQYYAPEKAAKPVLDWVGKILDQYPLEETVTASAFAQETDLMYYGRSVAEDSADCDALYAQRDSDGSWVQRVKGEWQPVEEDPSTVHSLLLLDAESAEALANWIDSDDDLDVGVFEFSTLYPQEFGLFHAAEAELDFEFLDRVFDVYDSVERSVNAQKQVRGPGGKFTPSPGGGEAKPEAPKARLSVQLPLVENISARIDEYLAQVAKERGEEPPEPQAPKEPEAPKQSPIEAHKNENREDNTFALDDPKVDEAVEVLKDLAANGSDAVRLKAAMEILDRVEDEEVRAAAQRLSHLFAVTATQAGVPESDVKPLYIAIVDDIDTDAVLDLVSLVPPQKGAQGDVSAWKRAAGQWVSAPDILTALRSSTPPSVVELSDENVIKEVIEQVDKSTTEEQAEAQDPGHDAEGVPTPTEPKPVDKGPAPVQTSNFSTAWYENLVEEYSGTVIDDSLFNWVEDVGGLPQYIKRIAKHLQKKGMAEGHAIATAVNVVKKYCATGDLNWPGWQQVNPGSKAEGCAAVASWEAKKAKAKATGIDVRDDWEFGVERASGGYISPEEFREENGLPAVLSDNTHYVISPDQAKNYTKVLEGINNGTYTSTSTTSSANYTMQVTGTLELKDGEAYITDGTAEFKQKTALDSESREKAADKGNALPDGSFPINNKEDLKRAVQAYGRAKDKPKAKRHIIKRAKALDATDLLPGEWSGSTASVDLMQMAARGFAFSDGSLLIRNPEELRTAVPQADTMEKQVHVIRRARALNRPDLIPNEWATTDTSVSEDLWGPHGELLSISAAGGADQWRGNAERLRRYWTTGLGGMKIAWRTSGDWTRCVAHLTKYLGLRARGYCNLRHKEMNGYYPGDRRNR